MKLVTGDMIRMSCSMVILVCLFVLASHIGGGVFPDMLTSWGGKVGMAIPTAICLIALALSCILLSLRK
jgi:hypothetical protein